MKLHSGQSLGNSVGIPFRLIHLKKKKKNLKKINSLLFLNKYVRERS